MTIQITPQPLPPVSIQTVDAAGNVVVEPVALEKVVVQPGAPVVAVTVAYGSAPGPSGPTTTDDLTEGGVNLYFTNARAQTALTTQLAGKANLAGGNSFTGDQTLAGNVTVSALKILNDTINRSDGNGIIFAPVGGSTTFYSNSNGFYSFLDSGNLQKFGVDANNGIVTVIAAGNANLKLAGAGHPHEIRGGSDGYVYVSCGTYNGIALYVGNYGSQVGLIHSGMAQFMGYVQTLTANNPYGAGWSGSNILATQDAVYDKIETLVPQSQLGIANGVATLGADGKVPASQLPAAVAGGLSYQTTWNAATNTPAIPAAAAGNNGYYYKVATAGTTNIDGIVDWGVGDWVVSNGTVWEKIDNSETVSSVSGRTGAIVLVKADVGLSNVDNTSDVNKPVSTAQQTALDLKLDDSQAGAFGLTLLGATTLAAAKGSLSLAKGDVGLGSVDNTSDVNKPVSTAQQAAIDAKGDARPTSRNASASFAVTDTENNSHGVMTGAGQTLTLGNITAMTSFTRRFSTAWSIACAGGLSKNGAAPGGVTTGSIAANSLITFLHEGAGVWVASGNGLT